MISRQCTRRAIAVLAAVAAATACAPTSHLQLTGPGVPPPVPPASRVMIMPAFVVGNATGNAGVDMSRVQADVTVRLLAIVRERFPDSDVASTQLPIAHLPSGYRAVMPQRWFNPDELHAVSDACERGAEYLLVPAITEWTEMRTDDPIGAVILPHNRVTIDLRLMRLQPPAVVAETPFHNRARLTLNQSAMRLVDDKFRGAVLQLFGG